MLPAIKIDATPILTHCRSLLNNGERAIVVSAPTGIGKSIGINRLLSQHLPASSDLLCISLNPYRFATRSLREHLIQRYNDQSGYHYYMKGETSNHRRASRNSHVQLMTVGYWIEQFLSINGNLDQRHHHLLFIDEAHDPSKEMELALRLSIWASNRYDNLQLILSSATIDPNSPIKQIDPTYILYSDDSCTVTKSLAGGLPTGANVEFVFEAAPVDNKNYLELIIETVKKIVREAPNEPLVLLLPSKEAIETVLRKLEELPIMTDYLMYRAHSEIPHEELEEAVNNPYPRRIIAATNIFQNSLTVPYLYHVVDSARRRVPTVDADGVMELQETSASQADLVQSAGRAGRMGNKRGYCHVLLSKEQFAALEPTALPDIKRSPLYYYLMKLIRAELPYYEVLSDVDRNTIDRDLAVLAALEIISEGSVVEQQPMRYRLTELGELSSQFQLSLRSSIVMANYLHSDHISDTKFPREVIDYHLLLICCYIDLKGDIYYRPSRKNRELNEDYEVRLTVMKELHREWVVSDPIDTFLKIWHTSFYDEASLKDGGIYVPRLYELNTMFLRNVDILNKIRGRTLTLTWNRTIIDHVTSIKHQLIKYLVAGYQQWQRPVGNNKDWRIDRNLPISPDNNELIMALSLRKMPHCNKYIINRYISCEH